MLGRLSQIQEKNIVCMKVLFVSCVGVGACWHFDELFCFLVEVLIYVPYSTAKLGTGWKNLIWRHSHWLLARLPDRQGSAAPLVLAEYLLLAGDFRFGSQFG